MEYTNNKKFQRELRKGGWKNPDKLFELKEDNYPISVLHTNGDVEHAKWHYTQNWVETQEGWGEFALWSERRPDKKNWFQKLIGGK